MITVFSAPKAFEGLIGRIQENAIRSWQALGPGIEVLLAGDDAGIQDAARKFGVGYLGPVVRNERGTPLVNDIFRLASGQAKHELMCYVNADILMLASLLPAVEQAADQFSEFLIVGQRWDITVRQEISSEILAQSEWERELRPRMRPHPRTGSDYFVFRRGMFEEMPPFALGRAGWDNWMIYACRRANIPVIDASEAVMVLHQEHDYAHLPDGQTHHRLPESLRNVAMAGGRPTMFTLADTTWRLGDEGLTRQPALHPNPIRRLESTVFAAVGPGRMANGLRLLFHPIETTRYLLSKARRAEEPAEQPMLESETPDRSQPHEV